MKKLCGVEPLKKAQVKEMREMEAREVCVVVDDGYYRGEVLLKVSEDLVISLSSSDFWTDDVNTCTMKVLPYEHDTITLRLG